LNRNRIGAGALIVLASVAPAVAQPTPAPPTAPPPSVEILLDRTGIASPRFLNRRVPYSLAPTTPDAVAFVKFRSLVPDRDFVVAFSGADKNSQGDLEASGMTVSCSDKCKAVFRVRANGTVEVHADALRKAYPTATGVFRVALYNEDGDLANSQGYLTGAEKPTEPTNQSTFGASFNSSYGWDPDLASVTAPGSKNASISFATPFSGPIRAHATGAASITLRESLGSRADADFELSVKPAGDLGDPAITSPTVQATKYQIRAYGLSGGSFTAGRFDVAAPSASIASFESGDSIGAAYQIGAASLNGTWLFRRQFSARRINPTEEAAAKSVGLDEDHSVKILQIRGIHLGSAGLLSLYHSRAQFTRHDGNGDGVTPLTDGYQVRYRTIGGEAVFPIWSSAEHKSAQGVENNETTRHVATGRPATRLPRDH